LHDPSSSVRQSAALALERLGWRPSNIEEQASFDVALGNTRAAALKGQAAVNPLLSELGDQTESLRRAAAEALEGVDDPRRVQPLLQAAADPEPNVRVSAIHALAKAGGEQVMRVLVQRLRDPDCHVRLAAALVLGKRDNPEFVPQFIALLNDSYYEVRLTAVQFLGRVRQPQSVEALVPRLKDSDSDVRLATTKALGEIGSPGGIEALVLALIDDERTVRHQAGLSLDQIDANWPQSEHAQRACAALERSLDGRPAWVRASACEVINKLRRSPVARTSEPGGIQLRMAAPDSLGGKGSGVGH
jgi:HEAT repeat protein